MRRTYRAVIWFVSLQLLTVWALQKPAAAGPIDFMKESVITQDGQASGWQSIYSAYNCVCHHSYAVVGRCLLNAMKQGAATEIMKASTDSAYFSRELSSVAAKRHEPLVPESSCDLQVLQGLMQRIVANDEEALDTLRRAAINNPTYPSLQYLKNKISAIEFEKSDNPLRLPSDVLQTGGRSSRFSKWKSEKFPLKVYIPDDAMSSKVTGYRTGDAQLLRSAFKTWQRLGGGKIRFVFEPIKEHADIVCAWVSEQKELHHVDAVGVTSLFDDSHNYISRAEIRLLTFTTESYNLSLNVDDQFRKNMLEELCLHESGHSLGLHHSSNKDDVMCPYLQMQPTTTPTPRDVASLNWLYMTNVYEIINVALDAIVSNQYNASLTSLDKALVSNPKDSQLRKYICVYLNNAATDAIHSADFAKAISLLTSASKFASYGDSIEIKERVLYNLHFAYLQSGKVKEAEDLEKQNVSLLTASKDDAAFLDQYGVKRESLPYYEQALTRSPDDLAIRAKFCFLLVMLARDDLSRSDSEEAIAFLTRAKGMLRKGMPLAIIGKVTGTLRQAYLSENRYDEADQSAKGVSALLPTPAKVNKTTPDSGFEALESAAKSEHPADWARPAEAKIARSKIKLAYDQYVQVLRQCAESANVKDEQGWAMLFIVRHKVYDGQRTNSLLDKAFELKHQLESMSDDNAVVEAEAVLPFKKPADDQ